MEHNNQTVKEIPVWKAKPEDSISTAEFAYDIQLTSEEYQMLKVCVCKVFQSVIRRERSPLKRTILLGRIVQDAGVIAVHESVSYNLKVLAERYKGE